MTRALIIDLAVAQDRLRSMARQSTSSAAPGSAPHVIAEGDQLRAHEHHLLDALHDRRLGFRALASDAPSASSVVVAADAADAG